MAEKNRKKMLYVGPATPKEGLCAELLPVWLEQMSETYEVTLLFDNYVPASLSLIRDYEIYLYRKQKVPFASYDFIVYAFENRPSEFGYVYECFQEHPGIAVLHDRELPDLVFEYHKWAGSLSKALYEAGGSEALSRIKRLFKTDEGCVKIKQEAGSLLQNYSIIDKAVQVIGGGQDWFLNWEAEKRQ